MAKSAKTDCARSAAAHIITAVSRDKHSLTAQLNRTLPLLEENQRSLCQQLCYGVLRWHTTLSYLTRQLLKKPLKAKDQDLQSLLMCGLLELRSMRTPPHAVLSETVDASKKLGKQWASGVINACLRQYQRNAQTLEQAIGQEPEAVTAHPAWLLERFQQDWPEQWPAIVEANNQAPPMMLRVNRQKLSRDDYLQQLQQADIAASPLADCPEGILLTSPVDVYQLPDFRHGAVSVQDGSAQRVNALLDLQPGLRILDACAAPGGKSCHILEQQPDVTLVAMDIDADRLSQIDQNADRLGLEMQTLCANASEPDAWWDGQPFDRILVDAPCSGTGVIRRHPDIKLLRRPEDIASLASKQRDILDALWPLVGAGGMMIYTTCSAMKQENEQQIEAFLQRHHDAIEIAVPSAPARRTAVGYQRLPGDDVMDGFYYVCLQRR